MDEVARTGVMAESSWLERPGLDKAAGEEFLREAFQVLLDEAVRKGTDVTEKVGETRRPPARWWGGTERGSLPDRGRILFPPSPQVCDWKEPQELRELLDLELRSSGELPERLLERCRDVIRYSVKTCEPRCSGFSPLLPVQPLCSPVQPQLLPVQPLCSPVQPQLLPVVPVWQGWLPTPARRCPGVMGPSRSHSRPCPTHGSRGGPAPTGDSCPLVAASPGHESPW